MSSIILTSFRQGVILRPTSEQNPWKSPPRLGLHNYGLKLCSTIILGLTSNFVSKVVFLDSNFPDVKSVKNILNWRPLCQRGSSFISKGFCYSFARSSNVGNVGLAFTSGSSLKILRIFMYIFCALLLFSLRISIPYFVHILLFWLTWNTDCEFVFEDCNVYHETFQDCDVYICSSESCSRPEVFCKKRCS